MDVTTDWFWEGNVVEALSLFLANEGWQIVSKANTHSKERGVDIHAKKGDVVLLVEAKGYPSKDYRDPARAGEIKRTNPTSQAQQWYSHALLKVLRLQTQYPGAICALAFPDFPRYRALFEETRSSLSKLDVRDRGFRFLPHSSEGVHGAGKFSSSSADPVIHRNR